MPLTETLEVTLELAEVFDRLGIDYLVGGSVASSLHGIPRATQDVDMLVRMTRGHVKRLVEALSDRYYVDEAAVADAVERKKSFNVIHLNSMFKIDVFVFTGEPLQAEELLRARRLVVSSDPERMLRVADAADIVIQKLLWYEQGGRVSERQWNDVIGVLKVSGSSIDTEYMNRWAKAKGVGNLLARALAESKRGPEG